MKLIVTNLSHQYNEIVHASGLRKFPIRAPGWIGPFLAGGERGKCSENRTNIKDASFQISTWIHNFYQVLIIICYLSPFYIWPLFDLFSCVVLLAIETFVNNVMLSSAVWPLYDLCLTSQQVCCRWCQQCLAWVWRQSQKHTVIMSCLGFQTIWTKYCSKLM